jgi:hypothetical protein
MGQAASAGAGIFEAAGSIVQGIGTSNADKYQAAEQEQAAQYGDLKAVQTNAALTRNLNQTLGNIDAVRAAARTDPTSPTGAAVRNTVEATGTENKNIQVDSIMAQAEQDRANAAYLRSASSTALLSGTIGAFGDLLKGFSGMPGLSSGS